MAHYIYRLYIIDKRTNYVIKTFLGNEKDIMLERFEKWFIKSNFDGDYSDIEKTFDYVQHANN